MRRKTIFFKHKCVIMCLFMFPFLSSELFSQISNSEASFDYESELVRSVPIPNSPEAEAFTQYGNTPVNMYAGSPEIGVPIYTHQGRELSLPVSLSYDASGIKVEQLATSAGLGWNLAVGGRISRITNGNPDDYIQSGMTPYKSFWNDSVRDNMLEYRDESTLFRSRDSVVKYFDFMNRISTNEDETQPDFFSLNAIGINDYIAFDVATRQAYALNNPNIIVEFLTTAPNATNGMRSITQWTITGADGTKYYFNEAEVTHYDGDDMNQNFAVTKVYNSSWVLTAVESANRRDTYTFNYTELPLWTQNFSVSGFSSYTYTINDNTPSTVPQPPYVTSSVPFIRIKQQRLDAILHNGKEIVSITYQNRHDIGASDAIDKITIKDGPTQEYKTYDFITSYFGILDTEDPSLEQPSDIRLKLDGIDIISNTGDLYQKYRFEYFSPEQVPSVVSKGQDYMGYYNGEVSNQVLFPEVTVGQHTFSGADRSVNFSHAIKGTLSRIYYPTGGYTDFEFELHTTPAEIADINENTHTQIYGIQTLVGSLANDVSCQAAEAFCDCSGGNSIGWCADEYGATGKPNSSNTSFDIQEAGNYTVKYVETNNNGGNVPTGLGMIATIFKASNATSCGPQPILDINQIIDLGTGDLLIDNVDLVFNNDLHITQLDINREMSVYLTPGCYQMLLVNPNDNITQLARVSRVETILDDEQELADVQRAGIRIKTIKDYTDTAALATEKEYIYRVEKTPSSESSGNVIFKPQFYTINNGLSIGEDCMLEEATSIAVTGVSSGGSQPHVAYSRVYEVFKKGTTPEDNGGYIQHDFYVDQHTGLYSSGVAPNVSSYRPSLAVGKEVNTKVYDTSGKAVQQTSSELADNASAYTYFGSFGMYVINKPEKQADVLVSKSYVDGFTFDFQQKNYGQFSTGSQDIVIFYSDDSSFECAYTYPPLPTPDWERHVTSYAPSFEMRTSFAQGAVGGMIQQVSTQFFENPSDNIQLQTTVDYEYDNSIGHLLRKKTTTLEANEQIEQAYVYASELTESVYVQMQARNQVQMPVMVTTTVDNAVNIRKSNYTAAGNGFYPASIEITNNLIDPTTGFSSNNPNEERIFFEYYANGNIKATYQLDVSTGGGTPSVSDRVNEVTYIWGYDSRYPIAKIVNGTYSEISSYAISLGSLALADNDRTLGYVGNEGALRQALDAMRNDPALSHTQISSYTYDPLIGVTSMTDPRGYTMYYEYDTLYRLQSVKDATGNILSRNEYNYKINN